MKVNIEIELKPFNVPNFVVIVDNKEHSRTEGAATLTLSEVGSENLHIMCNEFRASVFKKAGLAEEDETK